MKLDCINTQLCSPTVARLSHVQASRGCIVFYLPLNWFNLASLNTKKRPWVSINPATEGLLQFYFVPHYHPPLDPCSAPTGGCLYTPPPGAACQGWLRSGMGTNDQTDKNLD